MFNEAIKQRLLRIISQVYSEEKDRPLTKNMSRLNKAVSEVRDCFKFLENVNYEIEKLTLSYLKNNTSVSEAEM